MNANLSISISQLLQAAKLLENNTPTAMELDHGVCPQATTENLLLKSLYKLGEEYQQRTLATKLRTGCIPMEGINSTGSSRRSSPTSMISSSCSSSAPGSPISHPTIHISSPLCTPPIVNNALHSPTIHDLIPVHQFPQPTSLPPVMGSRIEAGNTPIAIVTSCGERSSRSSISSNAAPSPNSLAPSTRQSRAAHNELEKNRRANLRGYLDSLKLVLPASESDSTRDTTLSLLTRAKNYIQELKAKKEAILAHRDMLTEENIRLQKSLIESEGPSLGSNDGELRGQPGPLSISSAFSPVRRVESLQSSTEGILGIAASGTSVASKLMNLSFEELLLEGLLPAPSMLPLLYPYASCSI